MNRRAAVAGTTALGTALLGRSLRSKPASREFYGLTAAVAGVWFAGGQALRDKEIDRPRDPAPARTVAVAAGIGVGAFAGFYGAALVVRQVPVLRRALSSILHYAHQGSGPLVLLTTLVNGVGEEVFFRGPALEDLSERHPVAASTALYVASTAATGNPALVIAAGVMGTVFAEQRVRSGGLLAPTVTHLTWSSLMLRFLPPLFPPEHSTEPG